MSDDRKNILLLQARDIIAKLKKENESLKTSDEPIAVIGMACSLPGASTLEQFWQNLIQGQNAIRKVPESRFNIDTFYNQENPESSLLSTPLGGFLDQEPALFDSHFFGISPKECEYLDPQQRIILEQTWIALEHAGINPSSLKNTKTGFYLGISTLDYGTLILKNTALEDINAYFATGNTLSTAAGRVAYFLGTQGPTYAVDTACSSSLVALHEACRSLKLSETNLGLVAGVNLILSPENSIDFSKAGMLSPNGQCNTFDKNANGYVRGEGCGVVVLKRLSDALKDNDTIYALIKGSAINHDGESSGLTVPNGIAQEQLIQQALDNAHIDSSDVSLIEAHGTGTPLGDPIEINALNTIFGKESRANPLYIGSVKTNIGHLEAASGMAGLIKTILSTYHGLIPPHLNFKTLNPLIDISPMNGLIPLELTKWDVSHKYAGVSSFGFSGTNAHVILEEAPKQTARDASIVLPNDYVFVLSAKSKPSLDALVAAYRDYLAMTDHELGDICYTAAVGRGHFKHRLAFIVNSKDDLLMQLSQSTLVYHEIVVGDGVVLSRDLEGLKDAYLTGKKVDWLDYYSLFIGALRKVNSPTYCFDRQHYWINIKETNVLQQKKSSNRHAFLQEKIDVADEQTVVYNSLIHLGWPEFVNDHHLYHQAVIAGADYVSSALSVLNDMGETAVLSLKDIQLERVLLVAPGKQYELQTVVKDNTIKGFSQVVGDSVQTWRQHFSASIAQISEYSFQPNFNEIKDKADLLPEYTSDTHQKICNDLGLNLDHHHLWIEQAYRTPHGYLVRMRPADLVEKQGYVLYPGFIDACFQATLLHLMEKPSTSRLHVPLSIESCVYTQEQGVPLWMYSELVETNDERSVTARLALFNDDGFQIGSIDGLKLQYAPEATLRKQMEEELASESLSYVTRWHPYSVEHTKLNQSGQKWVVLGEQTNVVCEQITTMLTTEQASVVLMGINALQVDFPWSELAGIIVVGPQSLTDDVVDAHRVLSHALLGLVQHLIAHDLVKIPLYFVSFDALSDEQDVGDIGLVNSSMGAYLKTLLLEQNSVNCWQMDFTQHEKNVGESLLPVLNGEYEIGQYRFRDGGYFAAKIEHVVLSEKPNPDNVIAKGCYLITGGLGALGLATCDWLLQQGAQEVKLVSRRKPDAAQQAQLDKWQEQGYQVTHAVCDIAEEEAVKQLLAPLNDLVGIYHAAGLLDDGLIQDMSAERLDKVSAAKVQGALWLHKHSSALNLQYFVMYSSVTSFIGSPGQLNYCIANSFLDALAHMRQTQNLAALSVHWGPWQGAGMASNLNSKGMHSMPNAEYFALLADAQHSGLSEIAIFKANWNALSDANLLRLNALSSWNSSKVTGDWVGIILSLPLKERVLWLRSQLKTNLRAVLALPDDYLIQKDTGFFDIGMDSLMAVELRTRLQHHLGSDYLLDATVVFEHPTLTSLEQYLEHELLTEILQTESKSHARGVNALVSNQDPIAVIGMSCNFPGGANSLENYWELLSTGQDGISEVPKERWDMAQYYDEDPDEPGKIYCKYGGFLTQDVSLFDPQFFGISPKETQMMDPQQRLVLEQVWKAIEDAGMAASDLKGTQTGVFFGMSTIDYLLLINKHLGDSGITAYYGTGNTFSAAIGRISYLLGLNGPNFPIDTACSSSLVATHVACQSLRSGESNLAIVGGVNLILSPEATLNFCRAHMLAADGHCKTFDKDANGYVRGEGCGVIILKRLSEALRDNDPIHAVIRGSAVNQDGEAGGLTVPNGMAQEAVIRQALLNAQLNPNEVQYVDAHGTGTSLGDPIEVKALKAVYTQDRSTMNPLVISSAKTYIGHLEAAAGIAGLIKTILSLKHEMIPRHRNFKVLNPMIDIANQPIDIPVNGRTWVAGKDTRRGGVSSFGFSGTNAHVILEEAPVLKGREDSLTLPEEFVFVLSAKSRYSLEELVTSYGDYLATTEDTLSDICYTAAVGRIHFNHRLALTVHSKEHLIAQLNSATLVINEVVISDDAVLSDDLDALNTAYMEGKFIDWFDYYEPFLGALRKARLPSYCFDRQRYWIDLQKKKTLNHGERVHELLGARLPGYGDEIRFLNELSASEPEYLKSHNVYNQVIFPGAGFIESALSAGLVLRGEMPVVLNGVNFLKPLRLDVNAMSDFQVSLMPAATGYEGSIDAHNLGNTDWFECVIFHMMLDAAMVHRVVDLASLKANKISYDLSDLYTRLSLDGLNYGPEFQVIREAYVHERQALVLIEASSEVNTLGYCIHPTLLDGAFQAVSLLLNEAGTYIPSLIESMRCYQPAGHRIWVELQLLEEDARALKADLTLYDEQGFVLCEIQGFRARATDERHLRQSLSQSNTAEVYLELFDRYELPEIVASTDAVMLYAGASLNAPLSWQREVGLEVDWSGHHVVVVYEGDFSGLVALSQRVLKSPPLSLSIVVQNAFGVVDEGVDPSHREVVGFWRTLTQEAGGLGCYLIDANPLSRALDAISLIAQDALPELELILRSGSVYVPRLYREEEALSRAHKLKPPVAEDYLESGLGIDTLYWAQRDVCVLDDYQLRVRIEATALNFRDALKAMDLYPGDAGDFGYECAGVVVATGRLAKAFDVGERVLVIGQGLLAGEAVVNEVQVCHLPKCLSMAQGAALPIVFLTANYGLNRLAKIKRGQKVLIHAAAGGVGLAAIELARLAGAEIYATASALKQNYVRDTLGIEHVYDSRSTDFGAMILADTNGEGVDVVLNSLTSAGFIESSLSCLKQGGVFLEIGKLNIYTSEKMDKERPDVTYHVIELDTRLNEEPEIVQQELNDLLTLFEKTKLHPLPVTEYAVSDSIAAFHYIQQAKHVGKVVLINPEPFHYKSQATYLITGGTGGLGLELAKHLIEQGVKHLALISRSVASDVLQSWIVKQGESGVDIRHYQADVADERALAAVLKDIRHCRFPLKGIFHTAGVVHDGMLMNLTEADFNKVLAPKVEGGRHLDALSRKDSLDCFVLFSSIASLLGSPGQANYSAANAYMDGLAQARRHQGFPALSINWGPFASVGMAAHLASQHKAQGLLPLEVKSAFQQMDVLLTQAPTDIGIMQVDWQKIADKSNPYLSHLVSGLSAEEGEWIRLLEATPDQMREAVLINRLKQLVAQVLTIPDATQIDSNKGFFEMGLDSLMAVDLKNKLQQFLGNAIRLSNTIAFDYANVKVMSSYLLEQLHFKEKVVASVTQVVSDEAIAIVGLSGEFPGAQTLAEFWQLLIEGREGISEMPSTRWDVDAYYDVDPNVPGKMNTRRGGFIRDIDQFDSAFFGISPKEATYLDPQQRLLLRHTWQALEHAGIAPDSLLGSDTGVFIGIATHDYSDLINRNSSAESINAYIGTGNAMSTASGRISYSLGLEGPNLAIDTACSSSLVALNEACERLSRGECRLAIVGGVNALLTPEVFINFSKAGMLAADGKCKTFDEKADGYVRGEGCGILIIKRLSDAIANNDHILAVVKASGINQDGASSGLTVPNGPAQERLLSHVLAQAGLVANDIDYVECHGTGTSLGDPIEMHALGQVYGVNRTKPLYLGSAKTNIGHLEAAAGVAGLIKVVLALNEEQLPAHLNFHALNPHIHMDFPGEIVTRARGWLPADEPRRAGVSSFGFSGTNAHVILEEAPTLTARDARVTLPLNYVFVLSAKNKHSLEQLVIAYCDYLQTTTDELGDICYTAAVGRNHFNHRLALVVHSRDDLLTQLASSTLSLSEAMVSDELVVSQEVDVLKKAYLDGSRVDWLDYYLPYLGALRKANLPTYHFDQQRYWIESSQKKNLVYGAMVHNLLGARLLSYGDEIHFLNELEVREPEYLASHVVFGEVIVPGAAFIESVLAAGQVLKGSMPMTVSDLRLLRPLRLVPGTSCDYQVSLMPTLKGGYEGRIDAHHQEDLSWNQYVTFNLVLAAQTSLRVVDIALLKEEKQALDIANLYAKFTALGLNYGPEFQGIREAYVHERQALVLIEASSEVNTLGYCIHPTLLDGAFQAVALLLNETGTYIPSLIESMRCYQPAGHRIWVEVRLLEEDTHALKADLTLFDEQGFVLCEIQGFRARATDEHHLRQSLSQSQAAEVYIESVDRYELPQVVVGEEAIRLYASDEMDAPLSWQRGVDLTADWSRHHVVVVYDNDLLGLVTLAQRALKEPPLSLSLVVQNTFCVADDDIVDPGHRSAVGFWRTLAQEAGGLRCYLIDANPLAKAIDSIHLIAQDALAELELILRSESVYVPRLYREEEALSQAHQLKPPRAQDYLESGLGIDTLYWAQRDLGVLGDYQLRVRIEATALNFRDALKAMHLYPGEAGDFGYECAGVVVATGRLTKAFDVGERVLVIGQGLFAGEVVVDQIQVCYLPKCLSMAQGAALPIVFLTANYGLNRLAKIKRGQKVLIHAAAGGVGLAAIELAQLAGAEIYATASALKRDYVHHTLGIEHVYDSRSTDFGAMILADTNGEGVDVVLNSLTGAGFIESSLSCLKQGGVFLEIGKLNIYTPEKMGKERPDVTYHVIELDTRLNEEPDAVHEELHGLLALFEEKKLRPLPVTEYAVEDTIAAFHYIQQAKHVGKVVVINPEPFHYKSQATYLITGGTGGLGLELAKHLIAQGVQHLALTSRSVASDVLQSWIVKQNESGVDVKHYQADVADEQALSAVFNDIKHSRFPLKGIFHAAGVLHDGMLVNLTDDDFNNVLAPKIRGSQNLDQLSRNESLDCFVLFSSIASLLGSPGQANYSAANAYMDGLVQARRLQDLPALSINWGPFAAVGMAAQLTDVHKNQGIIPLDVQSAFELMDNLLSSSHAEIGVMQVDWQRIPIHDNPYLSHLVSAKVVLEGEWIKLLEAAPIDRREHILTNKLKQVLAHILHVQEAEKIDANVGFFELGFDSLMLMDLSSKIQVQIAQHVDVSLNVLLDHATVNQLSTYISERLNERLKSNEFGLILEEPHKFSLIHTPKQRLILALENQVRVYHLTKLHPPNYNLAVIFEMNPLLDLEILSQSIQSFLQENDIYKINLVQIDDELYMKRNPHRDIQINTLMVTGDEFEAAIQPFVYKPYQLDVDDLIRITLFVDNQAKTIHMGIACHHIICDLVSFYFMIKEILERYNQLKNTGVITDSIKRSFDYFDYSVSCQQYFSSEQYKPVEEYWLSQFKDVTQSSLIAPDRYNPSMRFEVDIKTFNLDAVFLNELLTSSNQNNCTVFNMLFASFVVFLNRHLQENQLVFGLATHGRVLPELANTHGFLTQVIPLMITIEDDSDLKAVLKYVENTLQTSFKHQPLDYAALHNQVKQASGCKNLARMVFNFDSTTMNFDDNTRRIVFTEEALADYDMGFSWHQNEKENIKLQVKFNRHNYSSEYIEILFNQYLTVINQFMSHPTQRVGEVDMMNAGERQLIAQYAVGQQEPTFYETDFNSWFWQKDDAFNQAIAIRDETSVMTYLALKEQVNCLVSHLLVKDIGSGTVVCLCLDRSTDLLVAMLAVLKTGAAFVLLDPAQPVDRLGFIIADSGARVIVTQSQYHSYFKQTDVMIFAEHASPVPHAKPFIASTQPSDLAYICYTSGSTGNPKGVMVSHGGLMNMSRSYQEYFNLGAGVVCSQYSSVVFDAFIGEVFPALVSGATVIFIPDQIKNDVPMLAQFINEYSLDHMFLPTVIYSLMKDYSLPTLKSLIAAGERLDSYVINNYRLFNAYGPTENTVCSTLKKLSQYEKVTIGKPIHNVMTVVVNEHNQPVPIGVSGELLLGGFSLAQGYLNLPDKTKESFINQDIFNYTRLYKTGDICRLLPNGDLEYIGRNDFQIKIRGIRIELGEIDALLQTFSDVQVAYSLVKKNEQNENYIVTFVQPEKELTETTPLDIQWRKKIYNRLMQFLPSYMLPTVIEVVEEMPLTINGKIDRMALMNRPFEWFQLMDHQPPETPMQKQLFDLWSEVLGHKALGIYANYFDVGGHSLNVTYLKSKINAQFSSNISTADLYENQSIADQEILLTAKVPSKFSDVLVPLAESAAKPKLFLFHPVSGEASCYVELARELKQQFSIYALQSEGFTQALFYESLVDMAANYVTQIKKVQPKGPYTLCGWSMGGIIAYEVAQQLSQTDKVKQVIMIDSYLSDYLHTANVREESQLLLVKILEHELNGIINLQELLGDKAMTLDSISQALIANNQSLSKEIIHEVELKLALYKNHQSLLYGYHPQAAQFPVLFYHATQALEGFIPPSEQTITEYWLNYIAANQFKMVSVAQTHFSILNAIQSKVGLDFHAF